MIDVALIKQNMAHKNDYLSTFATKDDEAIRLINYDASNDPFTAVVGESTRKYVFPWWKPLLIGLDILIVAAMGFATYYILKPKKNDVL